MEVGVDGEAEEQPMDQNSNAMEVTNARAKSRKTTEEMVKRYVLQGRQRLAATSPRPEKMENKRRGLRPRMDTKELLKKKKKKKFTLSEF